MRRILRAIGFCCLSTLVFPAFGQAKDSSNVAGQAKLRHLKREKVRVTRVIDSLKEQGEKQFVIMNTADSMTTQIKERMQRVNNVTQSATNRYQMDSLNIVLQADIELKNILEKQLDNTLVLMDSLIGVRNRLTSRITKAGAQH